MKSAWSYVIQNWDEQKTDENKMKLSIKTHFKKI